MSAFFDIYENNDENKQIIEYNKMYQKTKNTHYLEMLDSLLPDYNERLNVSANVYAATSITNMPNKNAAIDYAKKYAVNANPKYNYYAGGDCANFASQIAYAGGMKQTVYWKPYTYCWVNADGFSGAAFGKKNKSTKWSSFVKYLKPGSFIAVDFNGDGKIDHIAFVTGNGPSASSKYIAQHTENYHKLSTDTKWPNDSGKRVLYTVGNP